MTSSSRDSYGLAGPVGHTRATMEMTVGSNAAACSSRDLF